MKRLAVLLMLCGCGTSTEEIGKVEQGLDFSSDWLEGDTIYDHLVQFTLPNGHTWTQWGYGGGGQSLISMSRLGVNLVQLKVLPDDYQHAFYYNGVVVGTTSLASGNYNSANSHLIGGCTPWSDLPAGSCSSYTGPIEVTATPNYFYNGNCFINWLTVSGWNTFSRSRGVYGCTGGKQRWRILGSATASGNLSTGETGPCSMSGVDERGYKSGILVQITLDGPCT